MLNKAAVSRCISTVEFYLANFEASCESWSIFHLEVARRVKNPQYRSLQFCEGENCLVYEFEENFAFINFDIVYLVFGKLLFDII